MEEVQQTHSSNMWVKFGKICEKIIQIFLVILLGLMVVAIAWQVGTRYIFDAPSIYTDEFLRYGLIWMGLVGAGYCFVLNKHLSLPILLEILPERGRKYMEAVNLTSTALFGVVLIYGGWKSINAHWATKTPMLRLPVGFLESAIFICGILIIISQTINLVKFLRENKEDLMPIFGGILTVILSFMSIYFLWQSDWMVNQVDTRPELVSTIVLFITFSVFLIIGSPIALGLAFAGILTLGLQIDLPSVYPTVGDTMFKGLDSFGFLALPFFILAGNIMNATGLARRLIDFAMLIGGRIPGSLWHTNVLANMLFGTLSGSGIAAATAIGGVINPVAKEKGYDMPMTTAINAASAPCGMLIPPSGALIVYSLITGGSASIIALFMAGYLPGFIMGGAVMLCAYFYAKRKGYEVEKSGTSFSEAFKIFFRAAPSLLLVVIVIAGILGGAFTAIEGSGIAVVYSLFLALIYRGLTVKKLFNILLDTVLVSGTILFLIACSTMMSWAMTFASIPETIGMLLTSISENKYVILLLINIVLLIVGVFMDMSPAMLIFTPIFFPVVRDFGIDPVHFGIMMVYNLAMGVVTPPVGTVLFVSCSISGEKIGKVVKPLLPIFTLQFIGLLAVTFIPAITMTIPRMLGL